MKSRNVTSVTAMPGRLRQFGAAIEGGNRNTRIGSMHAYAIEPVPASVTPTSGWVVVAVLFGLLAIA